MRTAWEVPHKHLTPEALHSLAEEFVTRDGTDYGQVEKTLEEKVAALMRQLERGEAAILYERSLSASTAPFQTALDMAPSVAGRHAKRRGVL